ncbi:MAG TPA: Ig-like domain-containing protein [Patescibacteria group bacterium]|nr:Ig-like domain-containing protein [Patescibacteria group bacterium]
MNRKRIRLSQSWKTLGRNDRNELVSLFKVLGITVAVIAALYFVGIKGLTYIGGFWNLFTGETGPTIGDETAPPPPTFNPVSPYTKNSSITVTGFAEPAAEITLYINGIEKSKTTTEAGGTFSFTGVVLPTEGKNVITATATDRADNISQKSAELIVTLDKKPPTLTISKPKDGQAFSGTDTQVHVEGKTEAGATVRVNENQATVLADGTFRYTLIAKAGDNKITVAATDKAGNEKKVELAVTYSP